MPSPNTQNIKKDQPKASLSLFKIDKQKVREAHKTMRVNWNEGGDTYIETITSALKRQFENTSDAIFPLEKDGYKGLGFYVQHKPETIKFLLSVMPPQEDQDLLSALLPGEELPANKSLSFVLLKPVKQNIYLLVGGRAAPYVMKYVDDYFGASLLTRLFDRNDEAANQINRSFLSGDLMTEKRKTRSYRSLGESTRYDSITKDCDVVLNEDQLRLLDLKEQEPEGKEEGVDSGTRRTRYPRAHISLASIRIMSVLSLKQYDSFIKAADDLIKKEARFHLNYYTFATADQAKDFDQFFAERLPDRTKEIYAEITGEDHWEYLMADKFSLAVKEQTADNNDFLIPERSEPISFAEAITAIKKTMKRANSSYIKRLKNIYLNWTPNDSESLSCPLWQALLVRYSNKNDTEEHMLLFGKWHVLSDTGSAIIKNDFKHLCETCKSKVIALEKHASLKLPENRGKTEAVYNHDLRAQSDLIVGHEALYDGKIELADLIVSSEHYTYLIHLKQEFNGAGARDVLEQIDVAARQWHYGLNTTPQAKDNFLHSYYGTLARKYKTMSEKDDGYLSAPPYSEREFKNMFSSDKKICFVAGFMKGFSEESGSFCAQFCSLEVNRTLMAYDFAFALMSFDY